MNKLLFIIFCTSIGSFHNISFAVDNFFLGTHFHDAGRLPLNIDDAISSLRLWDARVGWNYLQPRRDLWNFEHLDSIVDESQIKGIEILLPLGLTPAWAASEPYRKSAYGLGNSSPPARLADWENYVKKVATRYKDRIRAYEIWNEPNRELFYSGSIDSLFRLTCSASRIIHEIDPTAIIVSPAATDQKNGIVWLGKFLDTPVNKCINVIGFHFYTLAHEPPETIIPLIQDLHKLLTKKNLVNLPVWNTEFGWYIENSRIVNKIKYKKLKPELGRDYLIRSFLVQAAFGIERSFQYAWNNTRMGVIEPDTGEAKPTATAFSTTRKWLIGSTNVDCEFGSINFCNIYFLDSSSRIYWTNNEQLTILLPKNLVGAQFDFSSGETGVSTASFLIDSRPVRITIKK